MTHGGVVGDDGVGGLQFPKGSGPLVRTMPPGLCGNASLAPSGNYPGWRLYQKTNLGLTIEWFLFCHGRLPKQTRRPQSKPLLENVTFSVTFAEVLPKAPCLPFCGTSFKRAN